jgi:sugar diacid utilization regulator
MVRRDMLDALIGGHGDAGRVLRLATSLRLRLADSYVVVLARGEEHGREPSPAARLVLRRILDTARAHLRPPAGSLLVGMRHGRVVALYPLADRDGIADVRAQCASLAAALTGSGVRIGVSSWHEGRPAIATSYAEARDAVRVAAGSAPGEQPIFFDDVLVDQLLRASPHADQIFERTLEPLLAYDRGRGAELVATLRAYVAAGFNLTRSAEALCVHPNTVVYRLRRVKELSGRDPHDPDDLMLLFLGLKLVELSPRDAAA